MKYSLVLSVPAAKDIESTLNCIEYALFNRPAAKALARALREEIEIILDNPELYAVIDEPLLKIMEIRFAIVDNHLLFYTVSKQRKTVSIIRFLHARRDWQSILRQSFTTE